MRITIRQPLSFSEIGRKSNQEDNVFPNPDTVTRDNNIFVLCDGVGGQDHGEVASRIVCDALGNYFLQNAPYGNNMTEQQAMQLFNGALQSAYDELNKKDSVADTKKMATTMTCVYLYSGGCLIAHIGDSRVYVIRPDKAILFQTYDHSLVNDLIKVGELTQEEAKTYPHRNVITRAMQPNTEHRDKADITNIGDLKAGDYIFMCSDGVLEHIDNDMLLSVFSEKSSDDKQKLEKIRQICIDNNTRDNNTCWIIPVDKVTQDNNTPFSLKDCINNLYYKLIKKR